MSSARSIKYMVGACVSGIAGLWYGATKLKIAHHERKRGIIEHIATDKNMEGNFINQNKIYFQPIPSGSGWMDVAEEMQGVKPMDLPSHPGLIKKAQQYCEDHTTVYVKYDQFLAANFFKSQASRQVVDIETAENVPQQLNKSFS